MSETGAMPPVREETERLAALRALNIVDTAPDSDFDAVCALARDFFKVPTALVSLIETDRLWFKARCGFESESVAREASFCAHAILSDDVLAVEDPTRDTRFANNHFVTGEVGIRFYAGAPLVLRPGIRVGTICLIDTTSRVFSDADRRKLKEFASIIVALLRLHEANGKLQEEIRERIVSEEIVARQKRELADREATLREANNLLHLAEEMVGAGHWRLELPERRRVWSPGAIRIFGIDPALSPPSLEEAFNGYHPDDRERIEAIVEAALQSRQPFSFEARVQRPDGTLRDVIVRGVHEAALDRFGSPEASFSLFGIIVDVTDAKRIEEQLGTRERELTAVLDNIPARIGYVDRAFRVCLANKAYADWSGISADAVLGSHVRDAIGPDAFAHNLPFMEAALRGERQQFEGRATGKTGELRDVLASYVPDIRDGAILGFFILVIDVTDLKRAEARLRASEAFLDRAGRVARVGAWDLNVASRSIAFSKEALRIHDIDTSGPAPQDDVMGFYGPEARAAIERAVASSTRSGESWDLEVPLVTAKGRAIWVRVTGEIDTVNGRAVRLFGIVQDITMRRNAEAEMRDKEERYRLLADNASDLIVRLDLGGIHLSVSPASRDLLGYEPDELVGTNTRDIVHHDDASLFDAMVHDLGAKDPDLGAKDRDLGEKDRDLGEKDRASITNRMRHRDGRWIWVEAKWRVLRDDAGHAAGFVASIRDVGARREAEERLRASENLYRTLVDTLPQMIWIVRADDRTAIYSNERFRQFHGPIGNDRDDRIDRNHPDDVARMESTWARAAMEERLLETEGRILRHDGQYRWHKVVAAPVRRNGMVTEWLGTALDIDDIVTARQTLLDTSDLLTLSQEAAGAGVFDVNLVSGETTLSRESAGMYFFDDEQPLTLSLAAWNARVHPEDGSRSLILLQKACAERRTYSSEFRVVSPDGRMRWIHGIGRAHYDRAGRPIRVIGLNFDVTERKAFEERLIEAGAIAEAARRDAEKASAAKTDFLASMSHEIRTPLNSVIGYTDLLLEKSGHAPDDRRKLELIREGGSALLTVVNDILDFSKIEAGQIDLDPAVFPIHAVVDNVLSMVSGFADKPGVRIERDIDPALPDFVLGDASRLRQILLNLLNNGVKFTSDGVVKLRVAVEGLEGALCRLRFDISDTGIGISSDRHARLFKRFSQVDGSIARRFGGTGLGLAISKSLVDLMGGEIGVDSVEGQGSTFWFRIAIPVASASEPSLAGDTGDAEPVRPLRILLVEDMVVNQDLARIILETWGHDVAVASDGVEAIEKVRTGGFDLVLMDVQMPGMDGMTATRRIRALAEPCRAVPIVAMTANVLPEQIAAFKAAGMDDHVGKPFKRETLLAALAKVARVAGVREAETIEAVPLVLHRETYDELEEMLGKDVVERLLGKLAHELERRFTRIPSDVDPSLLARDAHAMIAASGSLGFLELSKACRDAEVSCGGGSDIAVVASRLQDSARLALREIASLT